MKSFPAWPPDFLFMMTITGLLDGFTLKMIASCLSGSSYDSDVFYLIFLTLLRKDWKAFTVNDIFSHLISVG